MSRLWAVARYEMKMQSRSLVFWLGSVLVAVMLWSEVLAPAPDAVRTLADYRAHPEQITGEESWQARIDKLTTVGFPAEEAGFLWADRMAIVFGFVGLFTAAFVLERDRLSRSREVVAARPVNAGEYVVGKYLGITLPLLGLAVVTWLAAMGADLWAQRAMGFPFDARAFLAPAALLGPTLVYVPALVLAATAVAGRGALVVPVYLAYLLGAGIAPLPIPRATLWRFIIRSDAWQGFTGGSLSPADIVNRVLYLVLAAALVAAAAWAWSWKRRAGR